MYLILKIFSQICIIVNEGISYIHCVFYEYALKFLIRLFCNLFLWYIGLLFCSILANVNVLLKFLSG